MDRSSTPPYDDVEWQPAKQVAPILESADDLNNIREKFSTTDIEPLTSKELDDGFDLAEEWIKEQNVGNLEGFDQELFENVKLDENKTHVETMDFEPLFFNGVSLRQENTDIKYAPCQTSDEMLTEDSVYERDEQEQATSKMNQLSTDEKKPSGVTIVCQPSHVLVKQVQPVNKGASTDIMPTEAKILNIPKMNMSEIRKKLDQPVYFFTCTSQTRSRSVPARSILPVVEMSSDPSAFPSQSQISVNKSCSDHGPLPKFSRADADSHIDNRDNNNIPKKTVAPRSASGRSELPGNSLKSTSNAKTRLSNKILKPSKHSKNVAIPDTSYKPAKWSCTATYTDRYHPYPHIPPDPNKPNESGITISKELKQALQAFIGSKPSGELNDSKDRQREQVYQKTLPNLPVFKEN